MLQREASLRGALAATTRAAVSRNPRVAEQALRVAVATSVYGGRRGARADGRATYADEAAILDLPAAPDTARDQYDQDRAFAIGWSYADYWRRRYAATGDPQAALDATEARLRLIGTTEVAEATSDERDQIIRRVGQRQEATTGSLAVFKVWDATLDKRTCPKCGRAHHTVVPFFLDFPDGRPGGVHGNCRCYEGTILLPFWFDYETDLAA
jgi:hypothetical protein